MLDQRGKLALMKLVVARAAVFGIFLDKNEVVTLSTLLVDPDE